MILNPDTLLYVNGTYMWSPELASAAWSNCYSEVYRSLRTGYNKLIILIGVPGSGKSTYLSNLSLEDKAIYFDSTLVSKKYRKPLIKAAFNCKVPIEAVFVDTPIDVCKKRNSCRVKDRQVPPEAFEKWRKLLTRPSFSEGFSKITWITPNFTKTLSFEDLDEVQEV